MYEWENDFLEVPVPPMASRDPPEPPETVQAASSSASRDGAYGSYGGGAYNFVHQDAPGPSLMGAFSALVHRNIGGDSRDREPAPRRNSRGENDAERAIADAHVGSWQMRRTPSKGSNQDATQIISLDEEEQQGASERNAPPPPAATQQAGQGPGWSYGFGWGRLFGNGDRDDDRNRSDEADDQFVAPAHARYVEPAHVEPSVQGRGVDELATPEQVAAKIASRSRENEISGYIDVEGYRETSPPAIDYGENQRFDPDEDDEHHGIVGAFVYGAIKGYTFRCAARCPCFCASCYMCVFLIFIVVGMILMPVDVESDFDAFMKTDVNSSTLSDTFSAALQERTEDGRRLQGAQLYMQYDVYVAYELREDAPAGSILDTEVITEIQKFEQKFVGTSAWKENCEKSNDALLQRLCMPGLSLVNYARPTLDIEEGSIVPTHMNFDGQGRDSMPMETSLTMIQAHGLQKIVLPIGFDPADTSGVTALRSTFRFKMFCCTSIDAMSYQKKIVSESKQDWNKFAENELIPMLSSYGGEDASEEEQLKYVRIFYDGNGFEQIEVLDTLFSDIWLALGSMGFVLLYLMFHTQSIFLSIMGLIIILLSVPLAYVVFAIIANTTTLSIASFLSLFLVVGLGSDVVFVYTDFWRDAERLKNGMPTQVAWTTKNGGKASLATTATTALSFFANLASTLRPLREFGVFMGFCVTFVWLLVTIIYVPLCAIDSRFCRCCDLRRWRRRLCRMPPSQPGTASSWQRAFDHLTGCLFKFRRTCILLFMAFWLVALITAIVTAETDTGVPNIFPADHNQNRGKKVMDRFASAEEVVDPLFSAPPVRAQVCKEFEFREYDHHSCPVFWCEVEAQVSWTVDQGQCQCYRKELESCSGATYIWAVQRIIGTEVHQEDLYGPVAQFLVGESSRGVSHLGPDIQAQSLNPILLQEWESGETMLRQMTQVRARLQRDPQNPYGESTCDYEELCFCGTYVCKLPQPWRPVGTMAIGISRAYAGGRALQSEPLYPQDQQTTVNVIFGIQVEESTPLLGELEEHARWSFFGSFEVNQPWAQRNLYKFCSAMPPELKVTERMCWIEDFRTFLLERHERFPVPTKRFNQLVFSFVQMGLTGLLSSRDFLWIRDGEVKACFMSFKTNVYKYAKTEKAIAFMKTWDKAMEDYNTGASRYARGAWHTSNLWVRAEAQEALVSSTLTTLIIVITLAFFGMLVFTMDIMLSFFVIFATVGVLCTLAFFICVVMSWPIGPIEVIALIVFIGYAVTYSLHLAHLYGSPEALKEPPRLDIAPNARVRYQRTVFAMKAIGSAALGSACTTVGCSCFLLFCTLTIFQKLGGVVIAVTAMSIITALAPLPSLLLLIGPLDPGIMCGCAGLVRCCQDCYYFMTHILDNCGILVAQLGVFVSKVGSKFSYEDSTVVQPKPPTGFAHGTAGGGIRTMEPVAQPAGMRPSNSLPLQQLGTDSWDAVERPPSASPRAHSASPRAHSSSPRAQALVHSAPSPRRPDMHAPGARPAPPVQPPQPNAQASGMQVDDVLLSEAFFDSKPFDIGTESPLEPIWSREIEQTSGRVRAIHEKSPRRAGGTLTPRTTPRATGGGTIASVGNGGTLPEPRGAARGRAPENRLQERGVPGPAQSRPDFSSSRPSRPRSASPPRTSSPRPSPREVASDRAPASHMYVS